ncbi:hypothetical protein HYU95_05555 [Candidatus Daviesbacteria bacterium]|nr:hypothetical protein [Candidatus Daviesbacteria bacterium]
MIKKYRDEILLVLGYTIFIGTNLEQSLLQEFNRSSWKIQYIGGFALIYTAYLGTKILSRRAKINNLAGAFIGMGMISIGIVLALIFLNFFNSLNRIQNSFNFIYLYIVPLGGIVGYFTKKPIGAYIPLLFLILWLVLWVLSNILNVF